MFSSHHISTSVCRAALFRASLVRPFPTRFLFPTCVRVQFNPPERAVAIAIVRRSRLQGSRIRFPEVTAANGEVLICIAAPSFAPLGVLLLLVIFSDTTRVTRIYGLVDLGVSIIASALVNTDKDDSLEARCVSRIYRSVFNF